MSATSLLVVGPNFTIDRTATIAALRPGEVLRTREVSVSPGGKGVNVVRYATALGGRAELVTFVAGRFGQAAAGMLAEAGFALRAVACGGEIRSTSILHEDGGRITVLNEPGPAVTAGEWAALEHAVAERIGQAALLVCCGSIPPGPPEDAYARLIAIARRHGRPAIVDVSGALLAASAAAGADVVTPNLAEAEALLEGCAREDVDVDPGEVQQRALAAAARLAKSGARVAVVTAGAAGAALAGRLPATTAAALRAGQGVVPSADEGVVPSVGQGVVVPGVDQGVVPGAGLAPIADLGTASAGERTWSRWFPAHRVQVRNPIGAGDAFVAGFAVAAVRGERLEDAVAAGIAAAAASTEQWWPGRLDGRRAATLRSSQPADGRGS